MTVKYQSMDPKSKIVKLQDSIVAIQDVLNEEVTQIPQELTYSVSWLVVDGKQISHLSQCNCILMPFILVHNEDEEHDVDNKPSISFHDASIHSLSFECELFLKNIKSRMFSNNTIVKAEMYHQLHFDEGLKQILPYLVNWIQNEVNISPLYSF